MRKKRPNATFWAFHSGEVGGPQIQWRDKHRRLQADQRHHQRHRLETDPAATRITRRWKKKTRISAATPSESIA